MIGNKSVFVIGTGTIGEPLIGLLLSFKAQLGIDDVLFHKRTPLLEDRSKVVDLVRRGALLVADKERIAEFERIGLRVSYTLEEALAASRVVVDCTPAGHEMKERHYRNHEDSTDLFVAQGSDFGFGRPYARGINDSVLDPEKDRYLQVVSCNTHNLSILISTLGIADEGPENLEEGRFVAMRRANDISEDRHFVPSPTVGVHDDEKFGTHHARDAWHLFGTLGYDLNLFSSAMQMNSQLMHMVQFSLKVRRPTSLEEALKRLRENDRVSLTYKNSANSIFSFGRDHGFHGRILNVTVVPYSSLHVSPDGRRITGFCFTPQDGNSLLSSVSAAIWALYPETYEKIIQCLQPLFFPEV